MSRHELPVGASIAWGVRVARPLVFDQSRDDPNFPQIGGVQSPRQRSLLQWYQRGQSSARTVEPARNGHQSKIQMMQAGICSSPDESTHQAHQRHPLNADDGYRITSSGRLRASGGTLRVLSGQCKGPFLMRAAVD